MKICDPMLLVQEFSTRTNQVPTVDLYQDLIFEEYKEWVEAEPDTEDDLKELADLVYVCYGYANAQGWDLSEAILRVHENNLGRCIQPDGTVKRRGDGKILKNKDYPSVELGDLV